MNEYLKPQSPLKDRDNDYIYPLTTADQVIMEDGSRLNQLATPKAGFIYPLATSVIPEGFLLCDGKAYLRNEYPELFAAVGTMYGEGDGSTTFNVPNLQTRVPVGAGTGYELGDVGGEETHILTNSEMPNHNHVQNGISASGSTGVRLAIQNDGNLVLYDSSNTAKWSTSTTGNSGTNYHSVSIGENGSTGSAGGSQPHNNMQPYTVVNYIIATGKNTGVSVADIITGAQALPLGVEYGGTEATNAADARRNLEITPENIGAMSMELLWENANVSSPFAEYTIPVDISKYKFLLIRFKNYYTDNLTINVICSVGGKAEASGCFYGENSTSYLRYLNRSIDLSNNNEVRFATAFYKDVNSTTANVYDESLIPTHIYGIKGVST